jgi:hypothetical protein
LPPRQQISLRGCGRQLARTNYEHNVPRRKDLIALDVLPRGSTFNQLYFVNNIVPDWKTANLIFRRQKTGSAFGCTSIIPCPITDRKSRQRLRRTTFPECRTRPIHQI